MKSATNHQRATDAVEELARRLEALESAERPAWKELLSTGVPEWDRRLPAGGLRRGSLVEWLTESPGDGAGALALRAARQACRSDRLFVVIEGPQKREGPRLYPLALGIDRRNLVVVRPANLAEVLWAAEQALRSSAVGTVWVWIDRIADGAGRRLQLAAEVGGSLGMLFRPIEARREPSWSDVRFWVQPSRGPQGRRLRVEILRARGAWPGQAVELDVSDETGDVHLAAELAHPAPRRRAAP